MERRPSFVGKALRFWRAAVVAALFIVPLASLIVAGTWAAWRTPGWRWLLWLPPLCWLVAFVFTRAWRASFLPEPVADPADQRHWTPRDQEALRLVEAQVARTNQIPPEKFVDPHFYLQSAMDLALVLAQHYHPGAKDPLGSLTVTEILAAAQLALEDSADWVQTYVPGSHLLTINHWRALSKAPRWFRFLSDAAWGVSLLWNPASLGRYLASRLSMDTAGKQLQAGVLVAFYAVYVRCTGLYLIEMNSGRLRGGVRKYREALAALRRGAPREEPSRARGATDAVQSPVPASPAAAGSPTAEHVKLVLVGQAGSGKSSLVRTILAGDAENATVVTAPATEGREDDEPTCSYRLQLPDRPETLLLVDTPGYGSNAISARQEAAIHQALRDADLVILTLNATSPARQADLRVVERAEAWFQEQRVRRAPPIIAVLTHIDALSPVLEWNPPYDWTRPARPKEQSMAGAVQYVREVFGSRLAAVVPVCLGTDSRPPWGISEWLLPSVVALLDEAHACALLRTLRADLDRERVAQVFRQLRNIGTALVTVAVGRPKTPGAL